MKANGSRTVFPLVILLLCTISLPTATGQTPATAAIPTEGAVWPDPNISIVINSPTGQPWYRQSYADDAGFAVARWGQSIIVFTDNHGHNYLRQLTFNVYINTTGETVPSNPDVIISFIQNFTSPDEALGVTQYAPPVNNRFDPPVTVKLAARDPDGLRRLTDNDMVNVATHEFGHALGIGHTDTPATDDGFFELMHTAYNLPVGSSSNPLEAPSTLDLYALTQIYDYLSAGQTLIGPGPPARTITLPASIPYTAVYPYPEQIEAYRVSLNQANQRIIILAILTVILLVITVTLAILLARRRPAPPPMFPPSIPPEPAPTIGQPG